MDCLRPNVPEVLARAVDGQVVLVHVPSGAFFRLDAVAGAIWSLIEAGKPVGQIVSAVAAGYAIESDQASTDIDRLIEQMLHEKVVVVGDGGNGHASAVGPVAPAGPYSPPRMDAYRLNVHDRLAISSGELASKVIDGEAIIINVTTGAYYSLRNVGGVIWSMVQAGRNIQQIVNGVAESYAVSPWTVRADLEKLVELLTQERLVTVVGCGAVPEAPPLPRATRPYEPPQLEAYRDMEDLLALDPPMPEGDDAAQIKDLTMGDVNWDDPKN
jgi:hypothetical protein